MAYEQRDNTGSLFVNDYKQSENHPDYKGKVLVNGKELEIAAWKKTTKNGKEFFSLTFSEPYKKKESGDAAYEQKKAAYAAQRDALAPTRSDKDLVGGNDFTTKKDDDIPFALLFAFIGLGFIASMIAPLVS